MWWKIASVDLGMIPRSDSFVKPSIVYVLPVPVWPYAMIVALYPSRQESTAGRAVSA